MANSASLLRQITKENNKLSLQLQKLANTNTAKTFKFNAEEAGKQRSFNAAEAATARAWQEQMSNTSHQREVADLKAAGLNPVLSANSGAQSYTTTAASASNASGTADSSAVGALAGIRSSENSARASIYGSDSALKGSLSMASAQRFAAEKSYQSALASAAAARYSADRHLEAQQYASDKHYESSVYTADKNYAAVMDKPQGSPFGIVDKYLGKGVSDGLKAMAKDNTFNAKITGVSRHEVQKYAGEPNAYAALSATGRKRVNAFLKTHGYVVSSSNSALVASFLLSGSVKYLQRLSKYRAYKITKFG